MYLLVWQEQFYCGHQESPFLDPTPYHFYRGVRWEKGNGNSNSLHAVFQSLSCFSRKSASSQGSPACFIIEPIRSCTYIVYVKLACIDLCILCIPQLWPQHDVIFLLHRLHLHRHVCLYLLYLCCVQVKCNRLLSVQFPNTLLV